MTKTIAHLLPEIRGQSADQKGRSSGGENGTGTTYLSYYTWVVLAESTARLSFDPDITLTL